MPYVYLVQPVELLDTNRFKVGMSSLNNLSRVRSYKKGTRCLFICECEHALEVERTIIKEFNQNYKLIGGREYFEVKDEAEMVNRFMNIVANYKKQMPIADVWMKRFAFKA